MDWIQKLKLLVEHFEGYPNIPEPGFLYTVEKPGADGWPSNVLKDEQIELFYSVFGGGEIGPMIRINGKSLLRSETDSWYTTLHDDEDFLSNINKDSSVAIGRDADGTPWFYDTDTGLVQSYYWKGGNWEDPTFPSLCSFVDYLFTPEEGDEDWPQVLSHAGINA